MTYNRENEKKEESKSIIDKLNIINKVTAYESIIDPEIIKEYIEIHEKLEASGLNLQTRLAYQQMQQIPEIFRESTLISLETINSIKNLGIDINKLKNVYKTSFKENPPVMKEAIKIFEENEGLLSIGSEVTMAPFAEKYLSEQLKVFYPDSKVSGDSEDKMTLNIIDENGSRAMNEIVRAEGLSQLLPGVNKLKLITFINYITQFAYLSMLDDEGIGRKILDAIGKIASIVHVQEEVYRARKYEIAGQKTFLLREMYGPPYGYSSHSRFNRIGEKSLYTCNDKETTLKEIRAKDGDEGTIYRFIIDQKLTILDMTSDQHILFELCLQPATEKDEKKIIDQYVLPNFVAECCKYHRIDAIKYRSVHDKKSINYVFFDLSENRLKKSLVGVFKKKNEESLFDF